MALQRTGRAFLFPNPRESATKEVVCSTTLFADVLPRHASTSRAVTFTFVIACAACICWYRPAVTSNVVVTAPFLCLPEFPHSCHRLVEMGALTVKKTRAALCSPR